MVKDRLDCGFTKEFGF